MVLQARLHLPIAGAQRADGDVLSKTNLGKN